MKQQSIFAKWQKLAPYFLSILRIAAALMFIMSGAIKLFSYPVPMPNGITAPAFSEIWVAGVLEFFGGALLLLGLCTRPIAFLVAGEMAVAYFKYHAPMSPWPVVNNGVSAALYCFIWLYISAAGPGPLSVEAAMKKGRV